MPSRPGLSCSSTACKGGEKSLASHSMRAGLSTGSSQCLLFLPMPVMSTREVAFEAVVVVAAVAVAAAAVVVVLGLDCCCCCCCCRCSSSSSSSNMSSADRIAALATGTVSW